MTNTPVDLGYYLVCVEYKIKNINTKDFEPDEWTEIPINKSIWNICDKPGTSNLDIGVFPTKLNKKHEGWDVSMCVLKNKIENLMVKLLDFLKDRVAENTIDSFHVDACAIIDYASGNEFAVTEKDDSEFQRFQQNKSIPSCGATRYRLKTKLFSHDMTLHKVCKNTDGEKVWVIENNDF